MWIVLAQEWGVKRTPLEGEAAMIWLDYDFIRDEAGSCAPEVLLGERTGWETVIFELDDELESLRQALEGLGDAIRNAERFVAEAIGVG
jgi:hypothetical protein